MIRGFFVTVFFSALLAAGVALLLTQWAFDKVWLPQVARVSGASITTESTRWDPKTGFIINGLKITRKSDGLDLSADRLEVDYTIGELKRGVLLLSGIRLFNTKLDLTLRAPEPDSADEPASKKAASRLRRSAFTGIPMETGAISIRNCTINLTLQRPSAEPAQLKAILSTLTIDQYIPEQDSTVSLDCRLSADFSSDTQIEDCKLSAKFTVAPDADFHFRDGHGSFTLIDCVGHVGQVPVNDYRFGFTFNLDPYRLKECTLVTEYQGQLAGRLSLTGPVDFNLKIAELIARVDQLSPELMNLWCKPKGFLVHGGTAGAACQFILGKESTRLQGEARLKALQFRRIGAVLPIPDLDGNIAFGGELFPKQQVVSLEKTAMKITQNKAPFLEMTLNNPMKISWAPDPAPTTESAELTLQIHPTDLTAFKEGWAGLPGVTLSKGRLGGGGKITASSGGRTIGWNLQAQTDGLAGEFQGLTVSGGQSVLSSKGSVSDYSKWTIPSLSLSLTDASGPRANAQLSGSFDNTSGQLDAKLSGEAAWFLSLLPAEAALSKGSLKAAATVSWNDPANRTISFDLSGDQLTGSLASLSLSKGSLSLKGQTQFGTNGGKLSDTLLTLKPTPESRPGEVRASAAWNPAAKELAWQAAFAQWNESNLNPLLAEALPGVKTSLKSLAGTLTFEQGRSTKTVSADLSAAGLQWIAKEPGATPAPTCDLSLMLSATGEPGRIEIAKGELLARRQGAAPTPSRLTGWYASPEVFQIAFDSALLDLTPFAPLESAWKTYTAQHQPPPPKTPPTPEPDTKKQANAKESKSGKTKAKKQEKVAQAASETPPPPLPAAPEPEPLLTPKRPALDRAFHLRVDDLTLPSGDKVRLEAVCSQSPASTHLEVHHLQSGYGVATAKIELPADTHSPLTIVGASDLFPLSLFKRWAPPNFHPLLSGLLTSKIALTSSPSAPGTNPSLDGSADIRISGASFEALPASQAFLKSAASVVSPELANARFTDLTGTLHAAKGVWNTTNLKLEGDTLHLGLSGSVNPAGPLDLRVQFAGRTDMLERAQIKMGNTVVTGGTLGQFGKTEAGFTTLPGSLPVRGELPDKIQADWNGWLASFGFGAIHSQVQDLFKGLLKKEKKD